MDTFKEFVRKYYNDEDLLNWSESLPDETTFHDAWELANNPNWLVWIANKSGVTLVPLHLYQYVIYTFEYGISKTPISALFQGIVAVSKQYVQGTATFTEMRTAWEQLGLGDVVDTWANISATASALNVTQWLIETLFPDPETTNVVDVINELDALTNKFREYVANPFPIIEVT